MAFNAYHLWQEPRLLDRIAEIAPRVGTVQLSDWREPPRSDLDRLLPGDGEIPLGDIMSAFSDAGYGGFFEIEVWSEELWNSDYAELLRVCRERFDALCRRKG
jgi:sugar phosphate isomerase/epimerase